jgi:hypothetical protein
MPSTPMPGLSSLLWTIMTSCSQCQWYYLTTTVTLCRASSSKSCSQDAPLAYEWIVDGQVVAPSKKIAQVRERYGDPVVIVFLHGLLGNAKVRPRCVKQEILTVSLCASSLPISSKHKLPHMPLSSRTYKCRWNNWRNDCPIFRGPLLLHWPPCTDLAPTLHEGMYEVGANI